MNTQLISMFNVALKSNIFNESETKLNFIKVNQESIKAGYFIHPDCCNIETLKWAKSQQVNYNSTFYKTWDEITSKSRFELFVDQIVHYCTTYGTDFALDNGYVSNDNPVVIPFEKFKVIMPVTEDEMFDKIMSMLKSGIALNSDTINIFVEYFKEYDFLDKVNIDEITNKEAQAIISNEIGRLPSDEFGMFRAIIYKYTGSATIIKDARTILSIKKEHGFDRKGAFDFSKLSIAQLRKLSRIFYRYKPLFLAMKDGNNAAAINKIRKLAKIHHKPLKKGYWETCLVNQNDLATARKTVNELNNFRKIQLMQSIKERALSFGDVGKLFVVRNGKMWVREDYKSNDNYEYLVKLYKILESSLADSISSKACKIKLPKSLELACLTSEKNFIGNIPMGSYVTMDKEHNMFGIYWKNSWGAHDLDLWYTDKNGQRYGWESYYYNREHNVIFSGDMTNANPEATEIFYLGKDCTEGNIGVNIYDCNGKQPPMFEIFVANENENGKFKNERRVDRPYIVDPNNVIFKTRIQFDDCNGLKKVGIIHDNKLFFVDLGAGTSRISTSKRADIINRQLFKKADSFVELKEILEKAGFEFVDEDAELDLSNPSKDDLIKLFA